MKICKYYILLLLFSNISLSSQSVNHEIYHDIINDAERQFFVNNNVDSSILLYEKAFDEFDFVFVKDVVNVIQIAYFNKLPYKKYFSKGFENRLKLSHLKNIKLLQPIFEELSSDKKLETEYKECRKKYLQRINFSYLLEIYTLHIKDQINKYLSIEEYKNVHLSQLNHLTKRIDSSGFPGQKIIGIPDKHIFEEIGKSSLDFGFMLSKYKNKSQENAKRLQYCNIDESSLNMNLPLYFLVHNYCSFYIMKENLKRAVKTGELYPRVVGTLYDNIYRQPNSYKEMCGKQNPKNGLFYLNPFTDYNKFKCSDEKANKMRKKWHVVELIVDRKKIEYQNKYGFKVIWDFFSY